MNHVRGLIIISYFFLILTNFRLIGTKSQLNQQKSPLNRDKNLHLNGNLFYVWKGVEGRLAIVDPLLTIVNNSYLCHF